MEQMHDIDKRLTVVEAKQDTIEKRVECIDIRQTEAQNSIQDLVVTIREFISEQKKTNEFMQQNLTKQSEMIETLRNEDKKTSGKWTSHYKWELGIAITVILALVGYLMKVILK